MKAIALVHKTHMEPLMAMSNRELEAWFAAGGLSVDVVRNCSDSGCPSCLTIEPAKEAA
jgi:hypothetical protein